MLSEGDRRTLLRIARETAAAALEGRPRPDVTVESEALKAPCGCFVTFKNRGRLRGCIGTFSAEKPLYETAQEMAEAALRDPRFTVHPVTADELARIDIEISALTPMKKVTDPLAEIELGRHGIQVGSGFRRGVFLPQVATETGWSLEEFLSQCCAGKAGLAPDAWRDPNVDVYRFEAEVFGEGHVKDGGAE